MPAARASACHWRSPRIGLRWLQSTSLDTPWTDAEAGTPRPGLASLLPFRLSRCWEGLPSEMTNAFSLTHSWKHTHCLLLTVGESTAQNIYFIRIMFTVRRAGCSSEEPQKQSSNCVLRSLEIVVLAQTKFPLLKNGFFPMLSSALKMRLNAFLVSGLLKRWKKWQKIQRGQAPNTAFSLLGSHLGLWRQLRPRAWGRPGASPAPREPCSRFGRQNSSVAGPSSGPGATPSVLLPGESLKRRTRETLRV